MASTYKTIAYTLCTIVILTLTSCIPSFKFNGSNINYDLVKTLSMDKFPIRCAYVWAPMESMFYNSLSDAYAQKTKLKILKKKW